MASTLALLVKNRSGVLARIANAFSRRGYNIAGIAAGHTEDPDITRITVCLEVEKEQVPLIIRQLYKQMDVLMVEELLPEESFVRELMLVKLKADAELRSEIVTIVDIFRGGIVDVSANTVTLQVTGTTSKLEALLEMLEPYEIMELVRTGVVAISRGEHALSVSRVYADAEDKPTPEDEAV